MHPLRLILAVMTVLARGLIVALPAVTSLRAASAPDATAPAVDMPAIPTGDLAAYGAVGFSVAENLRLQDLPWTPAQFEAFVAGIRASFAGADYPRDEATQAGFEELAAQIRAAQAASPTAVTAPAPARDDVAVFMEEMRRQFSLQQADSGLLFRVSAPGVGPRPAKDDVVTISFQATSPDAPKEGLPQLSAAHLRLRVADLMPGLAEGVQMLALDGTILLLLPPGLSFGSSTWPEGVTPGTPLMFRLQLHDLEVAEAAP